MELSTSYIVVPNAHSARTPCLVQELVSSEHYDANKGTVDAQNRFGKFAVYGDSFGMSPSD